MPTSSNRDFFSLNHELPRTSPRFQCTGLVLPLRQCPCSWWYVITQGLRMLRQVDQRRNQVPALQLIRVLHHADAVIPISCSSCLVVTVEVPNLGLLICRSTRRIDDSVLPVIDDLFSQFDVILHLLPIK